MQYGTMHNVETPFSGRPDNSSCIPKDVKMITVLLMCNKEERNSSVGILRKLQFQILEYLPYIILTISGNYHQIGPFEIVSKIRRLSIYEQLNEAVSIS
ncbi:hypothetical protein ANTPLA_LOCUS5614 [Anthophora plagiata]